MRKSLQRVEKMAPLVEDTLREYRDLGRSLNNTIPDLRRTNDEIRELAKRSREAVPGFERDAEDVASAARTWDKLGENLRVLLQANQDKIVQAVDRLNDVLARTAAVLSDENQRNVAATLKNMEAGTRGLEGVTHNADELLKEGRSTLRRFNETMTHLDEAANDIRKLTKPFADRGDAVAANLDASLDKLNRTLSDLREIVRVAGQSDGTLHRFLTDPSLYNHLDEAACAATKLTPRLDRILKDMETFADKLARHPESIGLGGVVRPGSGLKDAPHPPGTFYPQP
jgi:phospholipid/cholesterol/gamma-HCH transport system substrate-binding protein